MTDTDWEKHWFDEGVLDAKAGRPLYTDFSPGFKNAKHYKRGYDSVATAKKKKKSNLYGLTNEEAAAYIQEVARDAEVVDLTNEAPAGVDATLAARGSRYGKFRDQAVYADKINEVMQSSPNWKTMAPDQREGLRIIANKIGRILNGDPDYSDSWHDIAGYATLVDARLKEEGK